MAILKPISGHGKLTDNHCREYILGIGSWESKYHGQRCQKETCINIEPFEQTGLYWDEQMDKDRHKLMLDISTNGDPVRTYNHYIFSPSPKDNVTVDELDKALKEWVKRVFQNKFSVVICYHNDNANRVQHAHMYINNVNWNLDDKHHRIGSYVTPQCWEYASQLWQYMCKERGWYSFIDKQKADLDTVEAVNPEDLVKDTDNFTRSTENLFKIDEEYFKNHRYFSHNINYKRPYNHSKYKIKKPYSTKFKRNYTKAAQKAKTNGKHLWTDDIRDLIEISFFQSRNVNQFIGKLNTYGVNVELTSNKDFKYSHPTNPQHRVTGAKLGKDYTRQQIYAKYTNVNKWNSEYMTAPNAFNRRVTPIVEGVSKTLSTFKITTTLNAQTLTLTEIANMIRTCAFLDSWNKEEMINDYLDGKNPSISNAIEAATNTLEKLDKVDVQALKQAFANYDDNILRTDTQRSSNSYRLRLLQNKRSKTLKSTQTRQAQTKEKHKQASHTKQKQNIKSNKSTYRSNNER